MSIQFQPKQTYISRLVTDSDSIISFTVLKRTAKTVTVLGDMLKVPTVFRVSLYNDIEQFKPWGSYSMCPVISAK
jgi:hypothetical protein